MPTPPVAKAFQHPAMMSAASATLARAAEVPAVGRSSSLTAEDPLPSPLDDVCWLRHALRKGAAPRPDAEGRPGRAAALTVVAPLVEQSAWHASPLSRVAHTGGPGSNTSSPTTFNGHSPNFRLRPSSTTSFHSTSPLRDVDRPRRLSEDSIHSSDWSSDGVVDEDSL
eukprot:EG_transcript_16958